MVSVILVNYYQPELTKRCIESIERASYKDKEIILIDNTYNNVGLAAAQNRGARQAKGDYLFFLNNDTLVKEDIFERLLEAAKDFIGIIGCRMFNYDGTQELDSGISLDKFGCPAGRTGDVFYPDGAIFIKRSAFEEIGGFDEKLFLYGEDRDLCWRAWLAGYAVFICHGAVFYHNSDCIGNRTYFYRRKISERNIIRSMLKNYSAHNLPRILLEYAFWSLLELGIIALTKPQAIFKCYVPAYWWNIINLKDTLEHRKRVIRRIPDRWLPFSKTVGKWHTLKTKGLPQWRAY